MVSQITGLGGNTLVQGGPDTSRTRSGEAAGKGSSASARAVSSDKLSLGEASASLRGLREEIARQPEVDEKRVARMREALASGSYQPDYGKIAGRMLGLERALAEV